MSPIATRRPVALGLFILGLAACGVDEIDVTAVDSPNGSKKDEVVYGTDNRQDVYAHSDATLRARAQQATVALMDVGSINTSNPSNVTFNADSLGTAYDLCSTERFRSDPTAAYCSGTLIDDDLVLTAGHCVTTASECSSTRFVFNYFRTSASAMQTVTTADVFSCAAIVVRQQATVSGRELDFAVLRLDRAATPRFTPAPVRSAGLALAAGSNVAVIGCGSGIPFKIDSGGAVRDARNSTLDYFVATTDTFGGNSGSGVYETQSYTVAGILVRGDTDYRANGSCNVVNVCTETGCMGEEITYVHNAVNAFCDVSTSARLCGSTPPPPPPVTGNSFTYSATATNNAQTGTTNETIALAAGDTLEIGTCGVTGAAAVNDTYLRLLAGGSEVAANDDACGGRGSYIKYTAAQAATVEVRAGCYSTTSCSGTVAWVITAGSVAPPATNSFTFTASNTNSARKNTVNKQVILSAGQTIELGTCTVAGASGSGDTYLRLYKGTAAITGNDDSCGVLSYLAYTVPAGQGGAYEIRAGCYGSTSCSGTVAYTVR